MIPIEEFQFSKELDKLEVGAEVEVMLETLENKHNIPKDDTEKKLEEVFQDITSQFKA